MKPDHSIASTASNPPVPRFVLGQVLATPDVAAHFDAHEVNALDYLVRHACGDWGEVPLEDAALNESALAQNARLLSRYTVAGQCVWLITEADRRSTTFLFPHEY